MIVLIARLLLILSSSRFVVELPYNQSTLRSAGFAFDFQAEFV